MLDQVITIEALDPETIACDGALLAALLQTLGVREHPRFLFTDTTETIAGVDRRLWTWYFEPRSADNIYLTLDLVKWWRDPILFGTRATAEFTTVATALKNFGEIAWRVKQAVPRIIVRRGDLEARIPITAAPARQEWLNAQVEGRIPFGTPFIAEAA